MGCSDSYENKGHTVNSQSQNVTNLNKPVPIENDLHFKIPKIPGFSPDFFNDVKGNVLKSFPKGNYTGQMKDGQRNGKGVFLWTSGDSNGHMYKENGKMI